jgi:hypothetical protein
MLNKMGHYRGSICDNGPGLQRVDSGFGASGLMGKITSFLEIDRHDRKYAPVAERVKSYREFVVPLGGGRGRDEDFSSPPAQNPAGAANAPGSHLGW